MNGQPFDAELAQRRLPGSPICGKVVKKGEVMVQCIGPDERRDGWCSSAAASRQDPDRSNRL